MLTYKKIFTGGANQDDDLNLVGQDEYLRLMNGRVATSEYGRNFRVENFMGTTLVSQNVYPPYGTQICIGGAIDENENGLAFFLYNTHGDHGIYYYDIKANTVYAVMYDSQVAGGLNFDKNYRIDRNARIVNGLLYWTDNYNQPRKVNIKAGIKANHPSYVTDVDAYTYPLSPSQLTLIKRPPIYPITTVKDTDGTAVSLIEKETFYFTYFYEFKDGETSALATYSILVPPNYNPKLDFLGTPDTTSNRIVATIPLLEKIDSDVQRVVMCIKFGSSGQTFRIKTWDKENSTDNQSIKNHNNGLSALFFNFYNRALGSSLDSVFSATAFHPVPLKSKTLELAKNRLHLGNNLSGYTAPRSTSLTGVFGQSKSIVYNKLYRQFKKGGSRKICVNFYDQYKRKCGAVECPAVVYLDQRYGILDFFLLDVLNWTLSNTNSLLEIPDWAYYYSIGITKDLSSSSFYQFMAKKPRTSFRYVTKNQNGTYTYSDGAYNSSFYALAISYSDFISAGMGYNYNEGDLYNLYTTFSPNGNFSGKILGSDGNYILLELKDIGTISSIPIPNISAEYWVFEVYTPYVGSENEIFYETGNIYDIQNPTTNTRQYSTTSGSIFGDTYGYIYDFTQVSPSGQVTRYIELMSPNYLSFSKREQIYGFVNIYETTGQQQKETTIQYSDTFIRGSRVNNLNVFQPLSQKNIGTDGGAIQKLQLTNRRQEDGSVMLIICSNDTLSAYLGEVQLLASNQNANIATTNDVIGTVNSLRNGFGTKNPESVIEYVGNVYWFDAYHGSFVRYSTNGIFPISSFKQSRFFQRYSKAYLTASATTLDTINGFHHVPTCINPFYKEVICTLPALTYENYAPTLPSYTSTPSYANSILNRFDIYDGLGKTMAFNYEKEKWISDFEFAGEFYEYLNNQMFGFKNGRLYLHDSDSVNTNKVYGVQYPTRLCFTLNQPLSVIKNVYQIGVEGEVPDFTVLYSQTPDVQITDLTANEYTDQEGIQYATFYRDRLSPNTTGTVNDKLFKGDVMKSQTPQIHLEWQKYDGLMYVNFINLNYAMSRGQKQLVAK